MPTLPPVHMHYKALCCIKSVEEHFLCSAKPNLPVKIIGIEYFDSRIGITTDPAILYYAVLS